MGRRKVIPATEAPATEAPATEAPATEAPATEAPATEAPAKSLSPRLVKMLTTSAGADPLENWCTGDKKTVSAEEAESLVSAGLAAYC